MIGNVFGLLTVLEESGRSKGLNRIYLCRCKCGKEVRVMSSNLKRGNSKSCGCVRTQKHKQRMTNLNFRHGETDTKLWKTWNGIVQRTTCKTSPHYKRYGGAGIGIHEEWLLYENFAEYIGQPPSEKHSIDRIDNSKGYFPGNIRWATAKQQASNRKTNKRILIDGKPTILSDAAKILGISKSTMSRKVKEGKFELV